MNGKEKYGSLEFLRKSGKPGVVFDLNTGKTYIGSSIDADIRLKLKTSEDVLCVVDVTKNGIATILNKSSNHPVYVNSIVVEKFKVLHHEDNISILGKCFRYCNEKISKKDVDIFQTKLNSVITTPSKKRHSVAAVRVESTKKTPNFKVKTPLQKKSLGTRQIFVTPEMNTVRNKERPKTTSKLIVSKALSSPTSTKQRRLSMDDILRRTNRVPKVSERNILLSQRVSSTILEEDSIPSLAQEKVACGTMDFLDISNISVPSEDTSRRESLRRRSSMRTPSRSSIKPQTLTDRTNLTVTTTPDVTTPGTGKSLHTKTAKDTPRNKSKLDQTPSTSTKIATPKVPMYDKISRNTPKKLPRTPIASENKTPAKSETPRLYKSILVNKSFQGYSDAEDTNLAESPDSPSSSNVPDIAKKRPKSQGSSVSPATLTIKRRKTEGNPSDDRAVPIPKKPPTGGKRSSVVDEGVEISDYAHPIPMDPRLSLGKASPRKSVRVSQRLNGSSWQSSDVEDAGEESENEEDSDSSVEKLNSLSNSQFSKNILVDDGELSDSSSDNVEKKFNRETWSNFNVRLRESARQDEDEYLSRKSSVSDEDEDETESEDEQLEDAENPASDGIDALDSSFSSDAGVEEAEPQPRRSPRKSDQSKQDTDLFDTKLIFVPQCRPPLRSYGRDTNKLSVSLRKSNTPRKITLNTEGTDSSRMSRRRSSTSRPCSACGDCIDTPQPRRSSINKRSTSIANNRNDAALSDSDQSIVTNNNSESELSGMESLEASPKNDSQRKRSLSRQSNKTPLHHSWRQTSVITVDDDSINNTPENNIIVDTPFEKPPRKLSKTLNSSIDDCLESSTPKSAIKGRRTKSIPYKPVVEEITPVTPEEGRSKGEAGFKTPLNTPGLFEDIKQSALRSRSRRSTSSNLREELDKAAPNNGAKRARQSSGTVEKSAKKRRVLDDSFEDSTDDADDVLFGSFETDEIFTDQSSDQEDPPNTPQDFKNLTDKPLITVPKTRSLTEPRKQRSAPKRLSLQGVNLQNQMTTSDDSDTTFSEASDKLGFPTDSGESSQRSSSRSSLMSDKVVKRKKEVKPPKNDLTDVRGIRRLMQTPKAAKSPKNDLTNIIGVKKMFSTPNTVNSPKNDLSNIAGIKKLLNTPKEMKSPKNDLTDVRGVKRLIQTPKAAKSPKNDLTNIIGVKKMFSTPNIVNSPKNDLSNVAGVKKLLNTPKEMKSPKNDLRNIPNLRRVMSPKQQNSPKNDLSDVAGLKKLLSTPKKKKVLSTPKKQKSPLNDLTKVPNLRRIMSPKHQNSPANDLSNVDGVADIFVVHSTESDVEKENNEDLFDKLFLKKPMRTYSGRSVSPVTRKASIFGRQERKSVGDLPYASPRIEKWLEDQAFVELERVDEGTKEDEPAQKTGRTRRVDKKGKETEPEKKPGRKLRTRQVEISQESAVESPRRARQKKNNTSAVINDGEEDTSVSKVKVTRNRQRKPSETESNTVEEKKPARRTRRKPSTKDDVESTDTESIALPKKRGRARTVSVEKAVDAPEPKRVNRRRGAQKKNEEESGDSEMAPPAKGAKSRNETEQLSKGGNLQKSDSESSLSSVAVSVSTRRGRARLADSSAELEPAKKKRAQKMDESTEMPPTAKRPRLRNVSRNETEPESKGGKMQISDSDSSVVSEAVSVSKKRGRARVAGSSEESQPAKTRSRRQVAVEETVELKEEDVEVQSNRKGSRRDQKKPEPVPEEPEKPTRKGGRRKVAAQKPDEQDLPKTQIEKAKEVLLAPEDSPRTRQRKGNFKKYGADFITETGNSKKAVRFEELEDEDAPKKRKAKAALEPLRRSKRTNK